MKNNVIFHEFINALLIINVPQYNIRLCARCNSVKISLITTNLERLARVQFAT